MYKSDNMLISFIAKRSLNDMSCFIGNNLGFLMLKYSCNVKCLFDRIVGSMSTCISEEERAVGSVVRDLLNFRDGRCDITILSKDSVDHLINELTVN